MKKGWSMNKKEICKRFLLYFFVMMFLLAVGCSDDDGGAEENSTTSPSATINGYSSALEAGDITKAMEYVSEPAQNKQKQALDLLNQDSLNRLAVAMRNATKEYEDNGAIKYRGTMTLPDGSTQEDTFWVVLEDDAWKITGL